MSGYAPALTVAGCGAALVLVGATARHDATFVGGIVLGVMVVVFGLLLAVDTRRRRAGGPMLSHRELRRIQQRRDQSGLHRSSRRYRR